MRKDSTIQMAQDRLQSGHPKTELFHIALHRNTYCRIHLDPIIHPKEMKYIERWKKLKQLTTPAATNVRLSISKPNFFLYKVTMLSPSWLPNFKCKHTARPVVKRFYDYCSRLS